MKRSLRELKFLSASTESSGLAHLFPKLNDLAREYFVSYVGEQATQLANISIMTRD